MPQPALERPPASTRLFIERFALTLHAMGMQPMTARLLALFVCTDADTLTAPDIAHALSVSPAAVSGALRTLQDAALIERVPVPGSRREHHRLLGDTWTGAAAVKQERFTALAGLAADGLETLPDAGPAADRLEQMRDFYAFLAQEMPALRARWEARRTASLQATPPATSTAASTERDRWTRHDWWGVVLDAPDVAVLARFYAALRGWTIHHLDDDASLDVWEGVAYLSIQRNPDYVPPTWPTQPGAQQMMLHLDFEVTDLDAETERAVALGATLAAYQPQEDVRVLLDPAGHPFCLYRG